MDETKDDKRSLLPVYVTAKDIALIEKKSLTAAQAVLKRTKKAVGKASKSKKLTWRELCDKRGYAIKDVIPFYLKVMIPVAATIMLLAFSRMLLDYDCEFFHKHKMEWEERTPTRLKGHTYIYNSQTKKMEPCTIEIEKIK